jgi:hypothetical protein
MFLLTVEAGIAFRLVRGVASQSEGGRCICRVVNWEGSGNGGKVQARQMGFGKWQLQVRDRYVCATELTALQ